MHENTRLHLVFPAIVKQRSLIKHSFTVTGWNIVFCDPESAVVTRGDFHIFPLEIKGLFIWEASQPGNQDSPASEISLDSYLLLVYFFSFIRTSLYIFVYMDYKG